MVINTQERAVSTDINRLQRFKEQDISEMFRHLLNVYAQNDDDQLGVLTAPNTIETPLRAEIVGNGFLVRPQQASLNLLIDAGMFFAMSPDAAPDESNYKYIRDDGVTALSPLTMTANASGSVRIDVIEVAIDPTLLITTDNRDVFNPSTGLFSAASLTKETRGRSLYRVTAGTPGAGMPARSAGWLPLAVAMVPNGATTVDTMTFWDVRPLIGDRIGGTSPLVLDYPRQPLSNFVLDRRTDTGKLVASGLFEGTVEGRRVGGRLRRGTPGTDADSLDLRHADQLASGFAFPVSAFAYVYLVTPFGLPRWARYTDGPAGRVPRAPKGIIVVTDAVPRHLTGKPSTAINLPTSTGLGGSTTSGICIGAVRTTAGSIPHGGLADGRIFWLDDINYDIEIAETVAGNGRFLLTEGTSHPAGAKALYVSFEFNFTLAATAAGTFNGSTVTARNPALNTNIQAVLGLPQQYFVNSDASPHAWIWVTPMVRVPIYPEYPSAAASAAKEIRLDTSTSTIYGASAITGITVTMRVNGWDLGP